MNDESNYEPDASLRDELPEDESSPSPQKETFDELPRSDFKIGRSIFTTIFNMTEKQTWLKEKQIPLIEVIDECENQEQQHLIFDLLSRFVFLDNNNFNYSIQKIADYIQDTLGLSSSNAVISASENGRCSDSSQLVVYSLKTARWNSQDWVTTSFVSSLTHLVQSADKGNLVLVDEFIGTGETAEKKVRWIRDELKKISSSPKIYFAVVAGMKEGIDRVRMAVDGIFSVYTLEKGISDFYPAEKVPEKLDAMLALEGQLGRTGRRGRLNKHSLGYKKSESLYSRACGNTPNNVFPVFWWEVRSDGTYRQTLLTCL